jgi:hypothetical protein
MTALVKVKFIQLNSYGKTITTAKNFRTQIFADERRYEIKIGVRIQRSFASNRQKNLDTKVKSHKIACFCVL